MKSIPIIETERLILRSFQESDLDGFAAINADPAVMKYLGDGKPVDRNTTWRRMASFIGHWELRGYGVWAVEEKSSREFVGRVGLWKPEGWPGLEAIWTIAPSRWGKGYAPEAARESIRYAFEELNVDHVISLIRPDNAKSIRVAEKVGERLDRQIDLFGTLTNVYQLKRDEWRR
ncbi:MAG: GNAT family N-acetyltransferase [Candidatus Binataceae bacterium]